MFHSLMSRISAVMWAMVVVSTLVAAVLCGLLLAQSHREAIRRQLQGAGTSLMSLGISDYSNLTDFEQIHTIIEHAETTEEIPLIIRIYDASKKPLFSTVRSEIDRLPQTWSEKISKPTIVVLEGERRLYETLVIPYQGANPKNIFYLQIASPLPKATDILELFWRPFILLFTLLLVMALVLARVLTAWLLASVRSLAEHLNRLDPHHMESWKGLEAIPEGVYLGPIAQGINLLIEKTKSAFAELKRMGRFVAHELRTPLTIIRGEAETALMKPDASRDDLKRVLKSCLEEVERMSEMITTILELGDIHSRRSSTQMTKLELIPWVRKQLPLWERTLGRPLTLDLKASTTAVVMTNERLLFRLIDNLIRNVQQHTPPETACRLIATDKTLMLQDAGPGLTPKQLSILQHQEALAGTGIGLHLCRSVAETCRIQLQFENMAAGGLQVIMTF